MISIIISILKNIKLQKVHCRSKSTFIVEIHCSIVFHFEMSDVRGHPPFLIIFLTFEIKENLINCINKITSHVQLNYVKKE